MPGVSNENKNFKMNKAMSSPRKPNIVKRISKEDIRQIYKYEKILGNGAFGIVRMFSKYSYESSVSTS